MNIWNKIIDKLNNANIKNKVKDFKYPLDYSNTPVNKSQDDGNYFSITNYNAQSWNPETHPEGIGDSHLVKSYDYNGNDKSLKVTYRDGFTAQYDDISENVAKEFNRADSKGRFCLQHFWKLPYKEV